MQRDTYQLKRHFIIHSYLYLMQDLFKKELICNSGLTFLLTILWLNLTTKLIKIRIDITKFKEASIQTWWSINFESKKSTPGFEFNFINWWLEIKRHETARWVIKFSFAFLECHISCRMPTFCEVSAFLSLYSTLTNFSPILTVLVAIDDFSFF